MGCWNETCMLSHMQIMASDNIKVIILVNNDNESNPCYHNQNYAPLILPFDAKYDDYGGIETTDSYIPWYSEVVLNNLEFVRKDDSEYKFENTTIEEFVREINEGLYLKRHHCTLGKDKLKLECVYVHSKLYNILVEDFKNRKPYNKDETIYSLFEQRYAKIKEKLCKIKELKQSKSEDSLFEIMDLQDSANRLLFKASQYGYNFNREYTYAFDKQEINIDDLLKDMLNYIMFAKSLEFGRYGYLSRCGKGGQDADVRVQKLISKFVLEFSERTYDEDCKVYTENESIYWYD